MRLPIRSAVFPWILTALALLSSGSIRRLDAQILAGWDHRARLEPERNMIRARDQFNGYTTYWANDFWEWIQYGNLFLMSRPVPEDDIVQNKIDIAEELGLSGFRMDEGFLQELLATDWKEMEEPAAGEWLKTGGGGNILVSVDSRSPLGQQLESKLPAEDEWRARLKSTQFQGRDFVSTRAFVLAKGQARLFVVSSPSAERRAAVRGLIDNVRRLLARYDLHRGWPSVQTRHYSVTCWPGHPLEIIGKAMNHGCDWLTFSGYMDYMLEKDLARWLPEVGIPFVAGVGTGRATNGLGSIAYRLDHYDGITPQDYASEEDWIRFVREHHGLIFRPVYEDALNAFTYDGHIGILGNKEQIDKENVPFVVVGGDIKENVPATMVLFVEKGAVLTEAKIYEAILARRNVAVLEKGQMMGAGTYRNALQMLLLDRVYLEDYFGDRIRIKAEVQGRELRVTLANASPGPVSGTLHIALPPGIRADGPSDMKIILPAESVRTQTLALKPGLAAMGADHPIAAVFDGGGKRKSTLAVISLPPVVSAHRLLFGNAPEVAFPVSLHNFTDQDRVSVRVRVFRENAPGQAVFETTRDVSIRPGEFQPLLIPLRVSPGRFTVGVSALGAEAVSQLGVGGNLGSARLEEVDLDRDGVPEFRMENGFIRATLLRTGARVIEYIVKERGDNVLFKLWPEKEASDRRPFRRRGFYPYGGFEDFLGQPSIETDRVYDAEILKREGDSVSVRMTADYFGNKLEKTYTLYGNTPLLEARFALTFNNPETKMLGPQPILALGEKHWTEDKFIVPSKDGRQEFRMRPEGYYGRVIDLREGWNAGYDTEADVSFLGAFPVSQPEFLHMWMNHPVNKDSFHYYMEFQPWVRIFTRNTWYFSYYLWGAAGPWEKAYEAMDRLGLITRR